MKRMILCLSVLLWVFGSQAQTRQKKAKARTTSTKKAAIKKSIQSTAKTNTARLTSAGSYFARTNNANAGSGLQISDPILTALDARANGADIPIGKSGIVGMPKRAYGFANGHLFFGTTGSVTSGTQTGSGAVGTGTGQGTFGSISPVMGVNGKSPYAGLNMWGNATKDSTVKANSIKQ